jgi:hypothetical protein
LTLVAKSFGANAGACAPRQSIAGAIPAYAGTRFTAPPDSLADPQIA